jgi:hypothetical protein
MMAFKTYDLQVSIENTFLTYFFLRAKHAVRMSDALKSRKCVLQDAHPANNWRQAEIDGRNELYVIKRKMGLES